MIVPGSGLVKEQAEAEGLDKIFLKAGFEWREPGCSMCLAMNPDKLAPGRALRLDLEPQLRGPPGLQGPHPSGVARDGGGRGDRRPFRRRAGVAVVVVGNRCRTLQAVGSDHGPLPITSITDQLIPTMAAHPWHNHAAARAILRSKP